MCDMLIEGFPIFGSTATKSQVNWWKPYEYLTPNLAGWWFCDILQPHKRRGHHNTYAHGLCSVVFWCGLVPVDLHTCFTSTSPMLGKSNDCASVCVTLTKNKSKLVYWHIKPRVCCMEFDVCVTRANFSGCGVGVVGARYSLRKYLYAAVNLPAEMHLQGSVLLSKLRIWHE